MTDRDPLYRRHRFPAEIIAHAVWLYFRFPLSLRMVEHMLAARRIIVSHQTAVGELSPMRSAAAQPVGWATNGTSTRPSFRSAARSTGCGALCGAKPPQYQGGQAFDAQAVEEPGSSAAGDDHR